MWGRIPGERSAELYPEAVWGGHMGLLIFLLYFSAGLFSCPLSFELALVCVYTSRLFLSLRYTASWWIKLWWAAPFTAACTVCDFSAGLAAATGSWSSGLFVNLQWECIILNRRTVNYIDHVLPEPYNNDHVINIAEPEVQISQSLSLGHQQTAALFSNEYSTQVSLYFFLLTVQFIL